jgi:DNA polymerase III subunit delta
MSPQELVTAISSGKFKSLYYFFGSEDYRITEAEKYVARHFLPDRQLAVNFTRVDGRRTKSADLLATLAVYPMLGERQVFAISDFQSYKPAEVDRVLKMLQPPDTNRLVILTTPSARTPKKGSAFLQKMAAAAQVVEFGRISTDEAARIISGKLSRAGLSIDHDALRTLTEMLAGNRGALELEVDKLISYSAGGTTISRDAVERVSTGYEVQTVFQLADDVISGDRARALRTVQRLLADGNSPTGMVFFLGQHFITLYTVKQGKASESVKKWLLPKYRNQASRYSYQRLERILLEIARTDVALRGDTPNKSLILEQLTVGLMAAET